ncbi:MAG: membrane protein insertion efficiency factor YidD [Clostridia bacterium]|nr:membrane protein insertion efficiency factor YidD [Clostridia bacterium]
MSKIFLLLIKFYQTFISGLKPYPTCKYYPTCSEYGYECIRIHGWFTGSFLALWRILRCNPFSRGGIDYPPEKKIKLIRPKERP